MRSKSGAKFLLGHVWKMQSSIFCTAFGKELRQVERKFLLDIVRWWHGCRVCVYVQVVMKGELDGRCSVDISALGKLL